MMRRRLVMILIVAAVASLFASAVQAQLSTGTKAPDFTLNDLNGKQFTLKTCFAKPGKVVVLDIWATWCPPCRREIPVLIDLNKKYKPKGALFVGVALDGDKATVAKFVKDQGVDYITLHDPMGKKIGPLYKVKPIPETYVIDKHGVIRYVHVGFGGNDGAKIENEVKKLLAEK